MLAPTFVGTHIGKARVNFLQLSRMHRDSLCVVGLQLQNEVITVLHHGTQYALLFRRHWSGVRALGLLSEAVRLRGVLQHLGS